MKDSGIMYVLYVLVSLLDTRQVFQMLKVVQKVHIYIWDDVLVLDIFLKSYISLATRFFFSFL